MRHALIVVLATLLMFGLAACGSDTESTGNTPGDNSADASGGPDDNSADASGGPDDNSADASGEPDVEKTLADMSDIQSQMYMVAADDRKKRRLHGKNVKDTKGAEFFAAAIKLDILEPDVVSRLAIPGLSDKAAADGASFTTANCSYCCPQSSELLATMWAKGAARKVMLCPNSRNWKAFGDKVPLVFGDSSGAEMTGWSDLSETYGITQEDWADPAGKLFGKKAPFDKVYE